MEDYENMTKERASFLIEHSVYEAAHHFERLESVNKVLGNGHHMQQKVAAFAKELLEERWIKN